MSDPTKTSFDLLRQAAADIEAEQIAFAREKEAFGEVKRKQATTLRDLALLNLETLNQAHMDLGLPPLAEVEVSGVEANRLKNEIATLKAEREKLVVDYNKQFLDLSEEVEEKVSGLRAELLSVTKDRDRFKAEIEHRDEEIRKAAAKSAGAPDTAIAAAFASAKTTVTKPPTVKTVPPANNGNTPVPPVQPRTSTVLDELRQRPVPRTLTSAQGDKRRQEDIAFGKLLRQTRMDKNVNQNSVADECNTELKAMGSAIRVNHRAISKIERGFGCHRDLRVALDRTIMKTTPPAQRVALRSMNPPSSSKKP